MRSALLVLVLVALAWGCAAIHERDASSCGRVAELENAEVPRGGVAPDPSANPEEPGFVRWIFLEGSGPWSGQVTMIRAASSNGERTLFRGEKREWVLVVEKFSTPLVAYSYLAPERDTDVWFLRDENLERTAVPRPREGLDAWACDVLREVLGDEIEFAGGGVGVLTSKRVLRRIMNVFPSGRLKQGTR